VRNSHDSFMVDYWMRRDKGKKERDVNEFSREENAPVNCCTLHCAVRAQLLCVSNLGMQRLVRAFFVPLYHCTVHFVWANSYIPAFFGTYQKRNSWYRSFFSPQYVRLRFARASTRFRARERRREALELSRPVFFKPFENVSVGGSTA